MSLVSRQTNLNIPGLIWSGVVWLETAEDLHLRDCQATVRQNLDGWTQKECKEAHGDSPGAPAPLSKEMSKNFQYSGKSEETQKSELL